MNAEDTVWTPREVDVTAEDQWSDPLRISGKGVITVTAAGGSTLTRQISVDGAWVALDTFDASAVAQFVFQGHGDFRIGCATGDYVADCSAKLERFED